MCNGWSWRCPCPKRVARGVASRKLIRARSLLISIPTTGDPGLMIKQLRTVLATAISAFRMRRDLALENLALRQQLALYKNAGRRPRLSDADRAFWVLLSRIWAPWKDVLLVVKPETVIGWHRKGLSPILDVEEQTAAPRPATCSTRTPGPDPQDVALESPVGSSPDPRGSAPQSPVPDLADVAGQPRHRSGVDGPPRRADRHAPGALRTRHLGPRPPPNRAPQRDRPSDLRLDSVSRARAELPVSGKRGHTLMARCAREHDRDLSATCTTPGAPSSPNLSAAQWAGPCAQSCQMGIRQPQGVQRNIRAANIRHATPRAHD